MQWVLQPKPVTESLRFNGFMLGHIVSPPYVKGYVSILSLKIEEIVKKKKKACKSHYIQYELDMVGGQGP